jgi:hypothetical protein
MLRFLFITVFKEVAARNHDMAAKAMSLMKATASEAKVHRRQRALAEVTTTLG